MTDEEFLAQFGHLAAAPGGVGRLRRLILDLAVRGRLAAQTEPVGVALGLLDRADAERQALVKSKAARKPKASTAPLTDGLPHPIPGP